MNELQKSFCLYREAAEKRIAKLEEQLAESREEAKQNALMVIRQGEKLDRLRWKPITPENLPKVGDEVGRYLLCIRGKYVKSSGNWTVMSVIESMRDWDLSAWSEFRSWTHFRPQSPPIQTQEAH